MFIKALVPSPMSTKSISKTMSVRHERAQLLAEKQKHDQKHGPEDQNRNKHRLILGKGTKKMPRKGVVPSANDDWGNRIIPTCGKNEMKKSTQRLLEKNRGGRLPGWDLAV